MSDIPNYMEAGLWLTIKIYNWMEGEMKCLSAWEQFYEVAAKQEKEETR